VVSGAADIIAVVLLVFFMAGVAVGVVAVIALSARRVGPADRRNRRSNAPGVSAGYFADDDEPPDEPDESQWWQTREGD
jgi:hypothetical protein